MLISHPEPGLDQSKTGGFLDPIEGTLILTVDRHPDRRAGRGRRSRSG